MKVVVSAKAYRDLMRIFLFYAEHDPFAAEAVTMEIHRQFEHLSHFPLLGRPWPRLGKDVRRLVVGRNLIFYRKHADSLRILRVLDGRMDMEAELLR